ncbi:formate dehydrogenase subunit beta [Lampropedia aestuarii]|uniref:Formate dehydrogenase subunit beta n=1 Tax=Lampropedia aestuarii TaxID=2562762 RepID=A0A4S5BWK2_9BURK|nr:formate dehydrogenase subunit beta [Lampropedia aestuarii]THJ34326.1 formate dehydrogenase subunit beta [Lampropedia aestuarii]
MSMQSLDIRRRSATTTPSPSIREPRSGEVAKLIDVSKCIGCKACQTACMEWNDTRDVVGFNHGVYDNPMDLTPNSWTVMRFTEYENPQTDNLEWLIRKDGCMHCDDPGCLKACPSPGAIIQYTNGIVDFQEENCIGCGYCVTGCPFNVPRISEKDHKAYKCTLCSDRVAVGQEPACVKTCPTGAIMFGTKQAMIDQAETRIVDLKERGYDQAGLYDPAGVGGTHVMYVLHHADKPSLYHGLPDSPKISPMVAVWKGVAKPLALAGLALAAIGGFFHYTRVGPNQPSEKDEDTEVASALARRNAAGVKEPHAHDTDEHMHGQADAPAGKETPHE